MENSQVFLCFHQTLFQDSLDLEWNILCRRLSSPGQEQVPSVSGVLDCRTAGWGLITNIKWEDDGLGGLQSRISKLPPSLSSQTNIPSFWFLYKTFQTLYNSYRQLDCIVRAGIIDKVVAWVSLSWWLYLF